MAQQRKWKFTLPKRGQRRARLIFVSVIYSPFQFLHGRDDRAPFLFSNESLPLIRGNSRHSRANFRRGKIPSLWQLLR
jgi:hypothetical protein